ncbi:hypothetical protein GCM10011452_31870 [Gemmobacter lanyuensis]|uniref:DUF2798 domain-containing protein n=1 Tax=Gemmobacter lanyuensis TaxID=1054497 RepID=A0A918MP00_9RHOB|nr:hypothetical protein GCM10011452_31870 [Gemmobacter lanyuensis]
MAFYLSTCLALAAMVTTVLSAAVTIGFGVSQFASGLYDITAAWWIAFAPFVCLFLARISRGCTVPEHVMGR